ncbi:neutral zinc metallopeptidase [Quadrisphaera sp. DSM 44207]|uniref:KPN_02809 family neutral zinc metallopeptidase n=1 Tax=Quadrisphaera sp. DSM 44207 TaxID=1881057 RepID=UPI0008809AC0|nr:neutral zinc metallopeptidase [Quadrisphaera sp. DSM 44207]SDQ76547.1 hypothetical protein SAMN05428996_2721 [Quadrisphaera sp. DSM 44207]
MTFNRGVRIDAGRARTGGGRGRGIAVGGGAGGVLVLLLALFLGVDPGALGGGTSTVVAPGGAGGVGAAGGVSGDEAFAHCEQEGAANASPDCRIIATAESLDAVWSGLLPQATGVEHQPPGLVLFEEATDTGCGGATSAVGPFYCPADATTYFDVAFFDVLTDRFGASGGPLAQEYVVAHEFGHAVQDQLGLLGAAQQDPAGPESGAVRSELQADCLAGVWAHHASTVPDPDTGIPFLQPLSDADVADALSAAAAVGDDRIQAAAQGRVDPEGWTHGSSEQRQRWFATGYASGAVQDCDTFAAAAL